MTRKRKHHQDLAISLSRSMLLCPALLTALPSVLDTIDKSLPLYLDSLTPQVAEHLSSVLEHLPVQRYSHAGRVIWAKTDDCTSVATCLIDSLSSTGAVKALSELSAVEKLASTRLAQLLLLILDTDPSAIDIVSDILDDIVDHGTASVEDAEDSPAIESIRKLLLGTGLVAVSDFEYAVNDSEYSKSPTATSPVPSKSLRIDSIDGESSASLTARGVASLLARVLATSSMHSSADLPSAGVLEITSTQTITDAIEVPAARVIGPSRPTVEQVEYAKNLPDDLEDDDVGPLTAEHYDASDVPLGLVSSVSATTADVREEWMLTPGEKDPFAPMKEVFGKSRQFQSGKTAKKQAEALAAMKAAGETEEAKAEAERTQKVLDEYKLLRGPSLMDAHLEKRGVGSTSSSHSGRLGFDRDRDLLQQKPMDRKQALALVESAKLLDTKFDKGSVQKSFL